MRNYAEPTFTSPVTRPHVPLPDSRPVAVLAVDPGDVRLYPSTSFTTIAAPTTGEAIQCIERMRPRVVAVDWDLPSLDGTEICRAARRVASTSVLVATATPEKVPPALKAGCDAVLLKPFAPVLAASRFGRLSREATLSPYRSVGTRGTNRAWPDTACPKCAAQGATSFDYSSYRRMWYACLSCDHVWLGIRQE
jgi:DNA-binding response OmpR family regulator